MAAAIVGDPKAVKFTPTTGKTRFTALASGEIDMLSRTGRPSPYTPSVLRSLLLEEPRGRLPMVYELNAIVSHAKLTIACG